jgi:hypothetical protein
MQFAKFLSSLAFASFILAAPHPNYGHKHDHVVYKTVIYIAYVTKIVGKSQPTPSSAVNKPAPVTSIEVFRTPNPTSYMATVNEYRVKLSLSNLAQDAKLETNARKTVLDSDGQIVH